MLQTTTIEQGEENPKDEHLVASSSRGAAPVYRPTTTGLTTSSGLRHQYMAASAANLASLAAGCVLSWSSPILPRLHADVTQRSWIGSLAALGAALGPFPAGVLADRLGRRKTLLLLALPLCIGWIVLTAASSVGVIYVSRLLLGIAVGAVFTVCPMYVGEIAEDKVRGSLGSLMQIFITAGLLFEYCIGPYVSYVMLGIISTTVPITFFVVFYFVPESPYQLLSMQLPEEANAALRWFRQAPTAAILHEMEEMEECIMEDRHKPATLRDLMASPGNVKALCLSLGLMAFQQLSGINVVLFYSEEIFSDTDGSMSASVSTIIVGVVMLIASAATPLLVDRLGRKWLLLASAVGMCVSQLLLAVFFCVQSAKGKEAVAGVAWLPVTCVVFYIIVYSIGFGPLPWAVMGELFQPNLKSKASTASASFCWILAFFITKFFSSLVNSLGTYVAFSLFSVCCCLAAIFVYVLLPETKGKSLQAIQDILNGRSGYSYGNLQTE